MTNNNIQNSCIGAIAVGTTGSVGDLQSAQVDATIQNNTIGTAGVAGSGSVQGNGIFVDSNGNGLVRTLITGNTIRQWTNRSGIAPRRPRRRRRDERDRQEQRPHRAQLGVHRHLDARHDDPARRPQAGDSIDACLDIGHATDNALKNQVTGTGEPRSPTSATCTRDRLAASSSSPDTPARARRP